MQPGVVASLELPQGAAVAGDRGDPPEPPLKEAGTSELCDFSSPKAQTFDLFNMVISFKRMGIYLEPLSDAWDVLKYILRWKMPICSLLCCITLNILFLTLNEVAWFSMCLLCTSVPAALGYLQDCSQDKAPEPALQRKRHHAVQRRDLQTVHLSRQEAMLEVKGLLVQLDEILSQACLTAESMYRVLYWEDHSASFLFYGGLLTGLCLVYVVPLCWVLAAVNNALFLWNRDFCRVVLEIRESFHQGRLKSPEGETENPVLELGGLADQTPTPTSVEDLSPGSIEEAEEAEPDDDFKDAIEEPPMILPEPPLALMEEDEVLPGAADFDMAPDNGLLSRNEPIRSKVSKLTEKLRKRYPTNNCGNCSNCSAVFSVLKKRRSCSNCGNSFCSRCCSYKVPKSCMGATAPEAQRETVFVCSQCHQILSKKD
ncbi:protrudin isoform X1 [Lepisosteus oculatus]|nr:PREDICTED: protrudin isoform X1 [Lepisosteus oculatus]XP_015202511.1 PREDICTED: protrudin isoform X1 [Lepisosteus oculatus]XP_015202513.1 PREDICTED: protrudin isoform X1 [Lepisosteus oculatus]XP_015202514.1 PREDICTED: protrudin isoform X1 [Lepisosteus oculatus]XP_015202515.1 PREDICTED: protrudin isoform X1 [Lepisosteus oculatus]